MGHSVDNCLALTGMGMVTPVGHDVLSSYASLRADITRLSEIDEFPESVYLDYDSEKVKAVGAKVRGITDGHLGLSRFARMATPPFKEAWSRTQCSVQDNGKTRFFMALPSMQRLGRDERLEEYLPKRITQRTGLFADPLFTSSYFYDDKVSAITALTEAYKVLKSGVANMVIIGCIDSLIEPATLIWLSESNQLKCEKNQDGLFPGEAAAFLVVEDMKYAARRNAKIYAFLQGFATCKDRPQKENTGLGLSEVIQETLTVVGNYSDIGLIICDLNGQRWRATEWGNTRVRTFSGKDTNLLVWHPADCIGDTGVASGAVSIILAAVALEKGYARTNKVLVWSSGQDGQKGSVLVSKA